MSSRPQENSPWPAQTPAPRSFKRRRISDEAARFAAAASLATRQFQSEIDQAEVQCENLSGNDVESCFPTADIVYAQHEFATFVWNSRLPEFTETNLVNVYLFHGDTNEQIQSWFNLSNNKLQAGVFSYQVNDTWWGDNGSKWDGTNTSYPFYFVITPNTKSLDGSQSTQTHFTAVQTTFADSVVSSMSASSASAASAASVSSASAVSAASASRASASSAAEHSSTSSSLSGSSAPTGNIQSGADSSSFPHWAIAVIVVLGFLAIASSCLLAFFIMRRLRHRRGLNSNRNSMGSASPMMAHVQSPGSPLLAAGVGGLQDPQSSVGHDGVQGGGGAGLQRAPSAASPDGASSTSHGGSAGEGLISGADAAIMADAFRKTLRKPDFGETVDEGGESPDSQEERGRDEGLLRRELAEEGRDIRSVSSSRGVRVETLSDSGDTVQE